MRTTIFIFTILLNIGFLTANAQDVLTNNIIIKLSKAGLGDDVIITKINSSSDQFNTSIDSMVYLKEQGVSSTIINAMVKVTTKETNEANKSAYSNDPTAMHRSGVYWYNKKEGKLVKLDPIGLAGEKANASSIGYQGIWSTSSYTTYTVTGEASNLQIQDSLPEFYFYFNISKSNSEDLNSGGFSTNQITSPNSFTCVIFNFKKKMRYFESSTSTSGNWSASYASGIKEKNKVLFKYEKVDEEGGIYRVWFLKPLDNAEYAFTFSGNNNSGMKLFDFGIENTNPKKR